MGRPRETYNKKEVRNRKEKKRKEKEKKRQAKKEGEPRSGLDDMIAYVDHLGNITSTPPDPDAQQDVNPEDIEVSVPSKENRTDYDPTHTGRVTFYNDEKGYGFIRDEDTHQSVFVHANQLSEPIQINDTVSFTIEKGPKGPSASNVKVVK